MELAEENVRLNKFNPEKISFMRKDATEFMKEAASRQKVWDIVILDPPKLAPRRKVSPTFAKRQKDGFMNIYL